MCLKTKSLQKLLWKRQRTTSIISVLAVCSLFFSLCQLLNAYANYARDSRTFRVAIAGNRTKHSALKIINPIQLTDTFLTYSKTARFLPTAIPALDHSTLLKSLKACLEFYKYAPNFRSPVPLPASFGSSSLTSSRSTLLIASIEFKLQLLVHGL